MTSSSTPLAAFFTDFQRTSHEADPAANLALFAETFLAAGPEGARAVPVTAFAPALAKRRQLFQELGLESTELVSLEETPLAPRYALARTRWRMTFRRPVLPTQAITVDSTYLIDTEAHKVLVYLAHQDIFSVLRERGIQTA